MSNRKLRWCIKQSWRVEKPNMLCLSEILPPSGHIRETLHSFTLCVQNNEENIPEKSETAVRRNADSSDITVGS